MISRTVARRYARALFGIGEKDGRYKDYLYELREFVSVLRKDAKLWNFVMEPLFPVKVRKEALEEICSRAKISAAVLRLIILLLENDRIKYLEPVLEEYSKLCDERENILRGTIFSPYPLSQDLVNQIQEILSRKFGKNVLLEVKNDSSLIAGLKLVLNGFVLDGSLKRQLEIMRERIMEE